jgi:hypothetical protein
VKEQAELIRSGVVPQGYPSTWPSPERPGLLPPGTAPFTAAICAEIEKRKAKLKEMKSGPVLAHFSHDEVRQVLEFWKIDLEPPRGDGRPGLPHLPAPDSQS